MIIVIEGPDGTGKTTLAREFEKRGFTYVHFGPPAPDEDLFETYTQALWNSRDKDVVFDRLHIGELVYGPVMRGKSKITLEQFRLLNRLLYAIGGKTIFCLTDVKTIIKNWEARKAREYVDTDDHMRKVCAIYQQLYPELAEHERVFFDYQHDELKTFVCGNGALKISLDLLCNRIRQHGVLGRPDARYLIVGEQAGAPPWYDTTAKGVWPDLPFYCDKRSSHFLNEALWEAGFKESELAFTNVLNVQGEARNLHPVWYELFRPIVIALGNIAHKHCHDQGIPHLMMQHPQYVKRFKSSERNKYVATFKKFRDMDRGN